MKKRASRTSPDKHAPEYPPALLAALNNLWRQGDLCRAQGQAVPLLVVILHPDGDVTVENHMSKQEQDHLRWRHVVSTGLLEAAENLRPKVQELDAPKRVM